MAARLTPPIPLDEARRLLLDGQRSLGMASVGLDHAAGRILAQDLAATCNQPPAPLSAMDGYAARDADLIEGARLRLIGESPAGAPFDGEVGPGECVRIATGGVVPLGADRIIIQENIERDGADVVVRDAVGPAYIRDAGSDFGAGDRLLARGTELGAAEVGLIAANGLPQVHVFRRPRVAILASGDELREPGQDAGPGAVFNSAAYALAALVEQWGGVALRQPILPDDLDRCLDRLGKLEEVDIIVPLGGASVGDRDVLRAAFDAMGAEPLFSRIAVIPGKPTWHARMPDRRAVLGLPGNPSSAFVCAHLLLKPLLFALTGRNPANAMALARAHLSSDLGPNGPREAFLRATALNIDGQILVAVDSRQDSGLQTPLAAANALVRRAPGASAAKAGEAVDFLAI